MVRDREHEQGRRRRTRKIRPAQPKLKEDGFLMFFGAASIQGGRDYQEDAYGMHPQTGVFMVADGMGGHAFGGEASRAAVAAITEELDLERIQGFPGLFDIAQRAVRRTGGNTTLICARYVPGSRQVVLAWAGDSGAVAISPDGEYVFLTDPHGQANIVSKYLGGPPGMLLWEPQIRIVQLEGPVRIVLYSDGLDPVLDAEIPRGGWDLGNSEPARGYSPQTCRKLWAFGADQLNEAAMMLCREAIDKGSTDNCTAIVLDFSEA